MKRKRYPVYQVLEILTFACPDMVLAGLLDDRVEAVLGHQPHGLLLLILAGCTGHSALSGAISR